MAINNSISLLWHDVISADINRLYEITRDPSFPENLRFYGEVILSYMQINLPRLRLLIERLPVEKTEFENHIPFILLLLTKARLQLRTKEAKIELVEELLFAAKDDSIYTGEIYFVTALVQESLSQLQEAKESYLKASFHLKKRGAFKKSLKSILNSIACESRCNPHHNFTPDYERVAKQALEIKEYYIAGVALNNISQEYQLVGAPRVALNYSQEAIQYLEMTAQRTVNYYLAFLHHCHLLIDIGRTEEARLYYEKCMVSHFPSVQEALKVLSPLFVENRGLHHQDSLTLSWKMRVDNGSIFKSISQKKEENFTEAEERIIHLLIQQPRTRLELADLLYGNHLDPLALENRIKVFFSKIRKKKPGLVIYSQGKYSICSDLYPELKNKVDER